MSYHPIYIYKLNNDDNISLPHVKTQTSKNNYTYYELAATVYRQVDKLKYSQVITSYTCFCSALLEKLKRSVMYIYMYSTHTSRDPLYIIYIYLQTNTFYDA